MVAAVSQPPTPSQNPPPQGRSRPAGEPSTQQENSAISRPVRDNGAPARKPRGRQVSSRYLSASPSPSSSSAAATPKAVTKPVSRYPSPLISRSTNSNAASTPASATVSSLPKRSHSVDRRRPGTPVPPGNANGAELSTATKMLITSTRSLSVSFQGEAFSLPISKTKAQATPTLSRKSTPERRKSTPVRDHGENSKPIDQHRWPARTRQENSKANPLSRSMDCSSESARVGAYGSGIRRIESLHQSVVLDESSRRVSVDGGHRSSLDLGDAELLKEVGKPNPDISSATEPSSVSCDLTASDTDSVSSGSTNSGVQEYGISRGKSVPRGFVVSAKFWQETNSRLRRLQDPGSPVATGPGSRIGTQSRLSQSKRFSTDGVSSSPRTISSPIRGASPIRGPPRAASPGKVWTSSASSPMRGLSPARVRAAIGNQIGNSFSNAPSLLSFSVDTRRGNVGEDRIFDAHTLRLLYNRYLQWRFANARADAIFMVQKLNAEKVLWNAWVTISDLRHSVTMKRIKLLLLRRKLKLTSILKGQILHLEEWGLLDREHLISLQGAMEALWASTLRLPVVGKAIVDVQKLKDAVGSALDVMQGMASSICSLLLKVEEMNSLVAELMRLTVKEKVLLEQCKDLLSALGAMQVRNCSLRTHLIQLNHVPTT